MQKDIPSGQSHSMIGQSLRFLVRVTLALEAVALIDRVMESGIEIGRPELYKLWQSTGLSTGMFGIVLIALAVGTLTSILMSISLIGKVNEELDDTKQARKSTKRNHDIRALEERRKRYYVFAAVAGTVFTTFSIVFFLHLDAIGYLVNIAAPFTNFVVIGLAERDLYKQSPETAAQRVADRKLIEAVEQVDVSNGLLSPSMSKLLISAQDRNKPNMLDAITTRDEQERYYTITELCDKLNVSSDRDSADRKKIYRLAKRAQAAGTVMSSHPRTGALLFPSSAYDRVYGNYVKVVGVIQLVSDRTAKAS